MIDEAEVVSPLFPFLPMDYLGFGLVILGLMIAAGGGIGGGGICLPIYILILEFPVKHAIPLTSVTVLGGAIANNLLNARKVHPHHPWRGIVDWDLLLQLEPMTIAGTLVGAILNDLLPDLVLIVLLLVLLSATAYKTLAKAQALHDKETAKLAAAKAVADEETSLVKSGGEYGSVNGSLQLRSVSSVDAEKHHPAWKDALKLTGLFVVITAINLLKGGQGAGGGSLGMQACGTYCFWLSQLIMILIILLFSLWTRVGLLERVRSGAAGRSDIAWDESNTIRYPAMAVVAGLVAGLTGVGGGILKAPMMIALGVEMSVAAGTSAAMILCTSSTATVSYLILAF